MAVKKGASPLSMGSLCGVGDLVLTCTGSLSRNWTVGNRLARGEDLDTITTSMRMVAEGVKTASSVVALSDKMGVEMPICQEVFEVLHNKKPVMEALASLQGRPHSHDLSLELKHSEGWKSMGVGHP
ncbi:unnamed protein product [Ectocarpus fasciculatus]